MTPEKFSMNVKEYNILCPKSTKWVAVKPHVMDAGEGKPD
jgi:hypothetical protein